VHRCIVVYEHWCLVWIFLSPFLFLSHIPPLPLPLPTALLRQSNPHWKAFFFSIDPALNRSAIDAHLSDTRMETVAVPVLTYDPLNAGYPATDAVLRVVLAESPECAWISVTASDNAYGSDVVERVLAAGNPDPTTKKQKTADMIISPLDSRRFLQLDMHLQRRFMGQSGVQLEDYCSLLGRIEHNLFTYAFRPVPQVGKIDTSAAFLKAEKLRMMPVFFGRCGCIGVYVQV
jgi:hypothetical protein